MKKQASIALSGSKQYAPADGHFSPFWCSGNTDDHCKACDFLFIFSGNHGYGDGAGNTIEENSSVFFLIRMG